jgi:hypothetical protein
MAKDKSAAKAERKAERKAAKKERKAEKLAQKGGVTKSGKKGGKKDKEKRKVLAERALNEVEVKKEGDEEEGEEEEEEEEELEEGAKVNGAADEDDEEEDEEEDEPVAKESSKSEDKKPSLASRPVGALVPFANPLADDKVAKKVFKTVKKGMRPVHPLSHSPRTCLHRHTNTSHSSRRPPHPQTRRQGSRQSASQVPFLQHSLSPATRCRRPCRRHLSYGCDQPHPRAGGRSRDSVHLRH